MNHIYFLRLDERYHGWVMFLIRNFDVIHKKLTQLLTKEKYAFWLIGLVTPPKTQSVMQSIVILRNLQYVTRLGKVSFLFSWIILY